jgi:hypothetical protein
VDGGFVSDGEFVEAGGHGTVAFDAAFDGAALFVDLGCGRRQRRVDHVAAGAETLVG